VIVDPVTDTVIVKAYDMRAGSHPLYHATMVCIDLVAKSQGGGMWKYPPGKIPISLSYHNRLTLE
jgi:tRNA-specific adenosine deaminase 3